MKNKKNKISISCVKNNELIADQCIFANSYFLKMKGLLGRKKIQFGEGIWLNGCNNIHMWFMKIPIDILFLKYHSPSQYEVTSLKENIQPWTILPIFDFRATSTLEIPIGIIKKCKIQEGDLICIN